MTTRFPSRTAPSWMLEHRGKIVAALAGGLTAAIAVIGVATWANSNGSESEVGTSTVSYPSSRDGVRGHVDFDNVGSWLMGEAVQPFATGPTFPASRENVRGLVFDGAGVTSGAIQPSAAEPKFPASRENVRGQVFDGAGTSSAISPVLEGSSVEPRFPASRDGHRGHVEGAGSRAQGVTDDDSIQPSVQEPRVPSNARNARGPVFD